MDFGYPRMTVHWCLKDMLRKQVVVGVWVGSGGGKGWVPSHSDTGRPRRRRRADNPFDRLSWFSNICLILIRIAIHHHLSSSPTIEQTDKLIPLENVITYLCTCQHVSKFSYGSILCIQYQPLGHTSLIEFNIIPPLLQPLLPPLHFPNYGLLTDWPIRPSRK